MINAFRELLFNFYIGSSLTSQLLLSIPMILLGLYLVKKKDGLIKLIGKIIAILGIIVLSLRLFLVLYFTVQYFSMQDGCL